MKSLPFLATLALLTACIDGGTRTYDDARVEYVRLTEAGTHPANPVFDPVIEKLRSVQPDSKRYAEAQKLAAAIEGARVKVRPPLAHVPRQNTALSSEVVAQLQACARLAELVGRDGGVDERMLKALDDCRAKAERLDAHENATP